MSGTKNVGIRVKLLKDFPIIKETLERMGIVNKLKKLIYPSCYIIHGAKYGLDKDEEIFRVVHFKELFELDGKESTFGELDELRLKTIVYFLRKWGLVDVLDPSEVDTILCERIDIIPFAQKSEYRVSHKYKFTRRPDEEPQGA